MKEGALGTFIPHVRAVPVQGSSCWEQHGMMSRGRRGQQEHWPLVGCLGGHRIRC